MKIKNVSINYTLYYDMHRKYYDLLNASNVKINLTALTNTDNIIIVVAIVAFIFFFSFHMQF